MRLTRWSFLSKVPPALAATAASIALLTLPAIAAEPWDGEPFAAKPQQILDAAAATAVDPEYGVQVFLEEGTFTLDEAGRVDYRFRLVYRVDSPDLVSSWSRVTQPWRPWYQDRPEIHARVITPEGTAFTLDPATLGEFNDGEDGPDVYSDGRTLRGPLPAVKVGAIVEEIHVLRDHRPSFAAGSVRGFGIGRSVPVHRARVVIDAPAGLPLRYRVHRMPGLEPRREEAGGRVRLTFERSPVPVDDVDVRMAPGDVARRPAVRFSTGASWQAIAAEYDGLVQAQLAEADLRKVVKKAIGKETDRARIIDRLLAHVQEQVRYTGIEFGEGSIVPRSPGETLKRRFGDCKDKAALLAALLREAEIPSHLALLNTGPGNDVDPELPGLGRFDHAILYVPGEPAVWIDPTHRYARAGELPVGDQGRWALIAAPATTELIRIPKAAPGDNLRRELREVFLAIEGPARIVETTETFGAFDREFRSTFAAKNESGLREHLENYVKKQYRADALGTIELSDVDDLSRPLELVLEAQNASRGYTSAVDAAVVIAIGNLVSDLPGVLRSPGEDEDEDEEERPRQHPVELLQPYVAEIRYRIHPPPGYTLLTKPDDDERRFGPATLQAVYAEEEDGTVLADLRFDTVRSTYSAEEAREMQAALKTFFEESQPNVIFHQVGEAHLEAGRIREALEAFQALVERFPDKALYRTQVSRAYLAAGLGAQARDAAAEAARLAPDSAIAHRTLGLILAHDELGRKFVPGFDLEGAEVAFRKAHELDPDDFISRGELAILLEHDEDGERYGDGSRLEPAIELYEGIRADLDNENLTTNLMASLLYAGRLEALVKLWSDAPRDATRDSLYLAAKAVVENPDAAVREASRIASQSSGYRDVLISASDALARARHYPEAAALLSAGARGHADSVSRLASAALLKRVQRHDDWRPSLDTPEGVATAAYVALSSGDDDPETGARALYLPAVLEAADPELLKEYFDGMSEGAAWVLRNAGLTGDRRMRDWVVSLASFVVDGDPETGYRVSMRPLGTAGSDAPLSMYIARHGDSHRLVGITGGQSTIGRHLLDRLESGELDAVRQWLRWLTEDAARERPTVDLEGLPFRWIWKPGDESAEAPRWAAAAQMIDGLYGAAPVEILRAALAADPPGDARVGIDIALAYLGQATDDAELQLEASQRLREAHPDSQQMFLGVVQALIRLKRFDEAEQALKARLEATPGEAITASILVEVPRGRGDLEEHRRRITALIDSGRATPGEYNNLAWLDIVEDRVGDETLALAHQAVTMTEYSEVASLHTLATVYAELGHVAEARDVLLALLNNRSSNNLESPDWYVLGRIAEHYGVPAAAREAYVKVEPPDDNEPDSTSTYHLASRRLKALERAAEQK